MKNLLKKSATNEIVFKPVQMALMFNVIFCNGKKQTAFIEVPEGFSSHDILKCALHKLKLNISVISCEVDSYKLGENRTYEFVCGIYKHVFHEHAYVHNSDANYFAPLNQILNAS